MESSYIHISWIFNCMRKADKNQDNKMTVKELKHFLRQINVEVDDIYAEEIFKVCSLRWSINLLLSCTFGSRAC